VLLQSESDRERQILATGQSYIQVLAKVESLAITAALAPETEPAIADVVGTIQVLIPLKGVVDVAVLKAKLEKSLSKAQTEVKSLSARLSNPNFVDKARPEVVQGARDALAEAEKQVEILQSRLRLLKSE
jgi:valyl-tRNA synthetase